MIDELFTFAFCKLFSFTLKVYLIQYSQTFKISQLFWKQI